jgi:Ca-activated chloride channel homolog
MDRPRFVAWFSGIGMLILFGLVCPLPVSAAQFSADMILGEPEKTLHGRIFVRDEKYRMEVQEGDQTVSVLVDEKAGLTRVLVPSEKIYLEMKNDDLRSAMNNPFVAFQISEAQYKSRNMGKETVHGYECTKKLIRSSGKDFLTAWFADQLGFAIKIVNHLSEGRFVELANIQEGPQEESLFQPPAGYARRERMPIEPPSWAADVPKAPLLPAPFEKTLSAGEMVRAPLKKGYRIGVRGENVSDGKAALTAVAFKDGEPVKEPSMSTYNFPRKGQGVTITPRETGAKADEVVIRVREGTVLISTEMVEAPEGIVLKNYSIKKMSGKELRTGTDRPFRVVVRDDEKDGRDTRGTLTLYKGRAQHKEKAEEFDLHIKNGETMSWYSPADRSIGTLSFNIFDGGIHVRLEYPEHADAVPPSWQKTGGKDTTSRGHEPQTAPSSQKGSKSAETKTSEVPAVEQPSEQVSSKSPPVAIMFILDASGSMWAQVQGKPKIDIAKEVMTELIRDLPDTAKAGLVAYGHRRKGDCRDVEELVPLGPVDKASLTKRILAISPKGKTPITLSVQKTAEKLRAVEDETLIILVSDGRETCGGDPCALVAELKKAGVRFILHVIGFDVTDEERAQLECMARAGGGEYFTAKTAQEFRVAARRAVQEAPSMGYLRVTALRNGQPFRAYVEVFLQGEEESIKSGRTGTDPGRPGAKLKPGVYDVQVTDRDTPNQAPVRVQGIRIEAGKTVEQEVNFSSGVLRLTVLKQGEPSVAGVRVQEAGTGNLVADRDTSAENPLIQPLLPGTYDVIVRDNRVRPPQEIVFSDVTLKAGETLERTAEFGEGGLSVEVLINGEKGSAGLYVLEAGTENLVTSSDTSSDNPRLLKLEPGIYDLKVVNRGSRPETERVFEGIEVQPGQVVKKLAEFGHGQLSVEVLINGEKGSAGLYVFEAGTNRRVTTGDTSSDNPRVFKLEPGMYDLKVVNRKSKPDTEVLFEDIEIQVGQVVEKRAEFGYGQLSVEAVVNGRKGAVGLYVFQAGTNKRVSTGDTTVDNPKVFKLVSGAYDLKVVHRRARPEAEQVFENVQVVVGETAERRAEFQEGVLVVRPTSGGQTTKAWLQFFHAGEAKRFATDYADKEIRLRPGNYEVIVRAGNLEGKPEKRVSFSIQQGQTTTLDVDF